MISCFSGFSFGISVQILKYQVRRNTKVARNIWGEQKIEGTHREDICRIWLCWLRRIVQERCEQALQDLQR